MWELSACIEWLFREEPQFADRIARCAAAEVRWIEFWGWRDKDLAAVAAALDEHGVQLSGFLSEPTGRLVDPRTHEAVVQGVAESARVAESLGCRHLVVLAGARVGSASDTDQRAALIAGLKHAAAVAADHGVTLLLEPINTRLEDPAYFLDSTRTGLDIVEAVSMPNVRLLYDHYHATIMGEDVRVALADRGELVGHVHLADVPDRSEPGTGQIDWPKVMDWLSHIGYSGRLGLEYMPKRDTEGSLPYIKTLASHGAQATA